MSDRIYSKRRDGTAECFGLYDGKCSGCVGSVDCRHTTVLRAEMTKAIAERDTESHERKRTEQELKDLRREFGILAERIREMKAAPTDGQ